jgi:hypothetical protein
MAKEGETANEFSTLAKLNNGVVPVVLNDNTTAAGNVTWALEWDFNIAPGGSALVSKDKYIEIVPEPGTLILIIVGILGLSWMRLFSSRSRDFPRR